MDKKTAIISGYDVSTAQMIAGASCSTAQDIMAEAENIKACEPLRDKGYKSSKAERRSKKTARYVEPHKMHGVLKNQIRVNVAGVPKNMKLKTAIQKNLIRAK